MQLSKSLKFEILKKLSFKSKGEPSEKTCRNKLEFAISILSSIAKDPEDDSVTFSIEILKKLEIYLEKAYFPGLDKLILKILSKNFNEEMLSFIKHIEIPEIVAGVCYIKYKQYGIIDERIYSAYEHVNGDIKAKLLPIININNRSTLPIIEIDNSKDSFEKIIYWNDFKNSFFIKNSKNLSSILNLIEKGNLKNAKTELLVLFNNKTTEKLAIYNLLSLIHLFLLDFHESIFYIDLFLDSAKGNDWCFGLNCKFYIERQANIPSLESSISILKNNNDFHFENKLFTKKVYNTSLERISLYSKVQYTKEQIIQFFDNYKRSNPNLSILFMFSNNDILYIYNIKDYSLLEIYWNDIKLIFENIMIENQNILSMNATTADEKRLWWSKRIELDIELGKTVKKLKERIKIDLKNKLMLILEDSVTFFPFEAVFEKPTVRILSNGIKFDMTNNIPNSPKPIFYLLDPANNLENTRNTVFEYFTSKKFNSNFLSGVIGRSLNTNEISSLYKNELFMYFGHGTGKRYFEVPDITPKLLFLFGCSSCRLIHIENFKSNGYFLRHIKKNRTLIGNLWDVTDKDLDRFTLAFLEDFFKGKDILESIEENRKVCKLKYLNSSALVVYSSW